MKPAVVELLSGNVTKIWLIIDQVGEEQAVSREMHFNVERVGRTLNFTQSSALILSSSV